MHATLTGWGLLITSIVAAVVIVIGLYAWDSSARAAEASLRPAPVAPLALPSETPKVPLVASSPAASGAPAGGQLTRGDATAGQRAFAAQCTSCHPGANAGIGPALYGPQFAERYPDDGPLAAVIRQGKGGMPAFAQNQINDQDLSIFVAYLRGLASGAVAPEPTPTPRPRQRGG
jgi:mono/diheme cytochrome c family protein